MLFPKRTGLIIWTKDLKPARTFEKYGNVHYISKKMRYVVLYVDAAEADRIIAQLEKLPYVKSVERSLRGEIPTEFNSSTSSSSSDSTAEQADQSKTFTYRS